SVIAPVVPALHAPHSHDTPYTRPARSVKRPPTRRSSAVSFPARTLMSTGACSLAEWRGPMPDSGREAAGARVRDRAGAGGDREWASAASVRRACCPYTRNPPIVFGGIRGSVHPGGTWRPRFLVQW